MPATSTRPAFETVADLLEQLGDIPPKRIRLHPTPGTATEQDVLDIHDLEDRLCALVDGIPVEKAMGEEESELAVYLGDYLIDFLKGHDLGKVTGADAAVRVFPGRVRIPDVSFVSRDRYPKKRKRGTIPDLAPDLAVEVLSKGNTKKVMSRKLREDFRAGGRPVRYADPKPRSVRVDTALDQSVLRGEDQSLDGGDVLPGFTLAIRDWFAEAGRRGAR